MKSIITTVAGEISEVLSKVNEEEAIHLSEQLKKAKRIFVYGEGRSGLMGKAFAMRLMHGGFPVYVIGETITPSMDKGDLLIAITGSGSTGAIVQFASKAKDIGARVFLVTTNRESKLAGISDGILCIPAATKFRREDEPETIQPLGNQFDQSVHLVLDAVIIGTLDDGDTNETMAKRHANIE
ncbi:6-phospho-3-hexuloisomerase [Bacillus sp. es.034]|jgi:6-phospho-3-hexuloisomerase|uniref:6-phospho-3-hexuloisomerase n=1 Tax=Bacillus sp. es.034 TaxID=1761763 RepID=UPI000BF68F5A|nr:6-phospho-3-hexuloisomerase [Bacillus sp. es.034]PFG07706.1 3-hexulose-6-phosphate isomerase [Bacillus sp. es.034]